MITLAEYVGPHASSKDWNEANRYNAGILLVNVNKLIARAKAAGIEFPTNTRTGSSVSGQTYGGFRPQAAPIGAPNSNHKLGQGIDLFDPKNEIDAWCMENFTALAACSIWIEHPSATPGWSHWQSVPPKSGKRAYMP